jgi:uncharacterized protein YbjT (DUF2867 family)
MILVTGATGFVGRALVDRLQGTGHQVRVLIPARARPVESWTAGDNPVDIVRGSIYLAPNLHQAMIGVHTVYHLAGAQWWGRRRDLEQIDLKGTNSVITAARAARIGRLIVVTHLGASPSSGYTLLKIKGQVEEAVKSSGLAYTIFRSGVVFGPDDSFVNGIAMLLRANPLVFLQPGQGEGLLHPIFVDDLVEALVRSLEHLDTVDQVLSVGGPEYITFNELVRTVMRVTRARRALVPMPPYLIRALSNLVTRFVPYWPMTQQWLDLLASNRTAPMGTLFEYFQLQPARFEDTIVKYMRGRRYGPALVRTLLRRRPRDG